MSGILKRILWSGLAALCLTALAPNLSQAAHPDPYWDRYWGWYDNEYRPYYLRRGTWPYPNYYYSTPPAGRMWDYYPRGYRSYYRAPGGSVNVGPVQVWW